MVSENKPGLRDVQIDKTAVIEEALTDHLAVVLSGMPGVGKKTAVRMLLGRHQDVHAVFCDIEEIRNRKALERRLPDQVNWYQVRKPIRRADEPLLPGIERFIRDMPSGDRLLMAVDGRLPDALLEFVWNGMMAEILPETFWFTLPETYRYLRECRSTLKVRDVWHLTGGWAGCVAMLVKLERQLGNTWTVWELGSRYEIRQYIREGILSVLPEDERKTVEEQAPFPRLNEEIASVLWPGWKRDVEERLLSRGAMQYVPGQRCWHVHPALRMAADTADSAEYRRLCLQAAAWYEERGFIQDALTCCRQIPDRNIYRECLRSNYDRISFLYYEKAWGEEDLNMPEFFYLEWVESFLGQDEGRMELLRPRARKMPAEIFLNAAYLDPSVETGEWMELLRENTEPGHPVRLYYMLGESVSFLCGLRDLSDLFACSPKKREEYACLWRERLTAKSMLPYRLAEQEYDFQTGGSQTDPMPVYGSGTPWTIRMGYLYQAYLYADTSDAGRMEKDYIRSLAISLEKEETDICRWNARALYFLAEARWGEKEKIISWVRESGGDLNPDSGKTRFHMAAEIKVHFYLGNYSRGEEILKVLLPYFEKNRSRRWLAEGLFQLAVAEQEKGRSGSAFRALSASLDISRPRRYVRLYTGYGARGAGLLEKYREASGKEDPWLDQVIREAFRHAEDFPDIQEKEMFFPADKLTPTEQMVLEYLAKGYSNRQISEEMQIRLTTVKSHIYHLYRKLDVSSRIQAVRSARELGII